MEPAGKIEVRVSRQYDAPSERIFDALLDPQQAGQFMFATETGQMVRAEIDPRVGGSFVFTDRREGEDVEHTGTYVEIERPRRLVFTFSVPKYSTEADTVAIEIASRGAGSELTLTHEMSAEWSEFIPQTRQGWADILDGLARTLGA